MKSTRTKKTLIIAIVSTVILIILAICLFAKPKQTESKQEELWEYVFSGNVSNMFKSYFEGEDYEELLAGKKYETTTDISFDGNIVGQEETIKHLKNLEINIAGKVNNETNQAMGTIVANYMKNEMFKVDYIKDNDAYGIKSDEVIDMYLGIRNSDLNLLFQKLGFESDIEKFNNINYKALLIDSAIIDSSINNIKNVLKEQIVTEKFTKQTERKIELCETGVTVDSYTLILNDQETYNLLTKVLECIAEDEQLLNAINSKYNLLLSSGSETGEQETLISKEKIQNYIQEKIQTKTFKNEQMVMATVYVLDNKMVKLDVNVTENGITNQYIIEALQSSNKMNLTINKQSQENTSSLSLGINKDENQVYSITIDSTENNEKKFSTSIRTKREGTLEAGTITNATAISHKDGDSDNIEIKIANTIKTVESVEIANLSATNCSFVNDMDLERIKYLYTAISNRLEVLYEEKMQFINSGELQQIIKPANEAIEKHNAEFEMYEGEYTGTIVVEMLNKVMQSNTTSEYLIGIEVKLTEEETVLEAEDMTVEKVQPVANLLQSNETYKITLQYQPVSGAIEKIKILKVGIGDSEEKKEVILEDNQELGQ